MTGLEIRDLTHDIDLDRHALEEVIGGGSLISRGWGWLKGRGRRFYVRMRRGNYLAAVASISPFALSGSSRRRDFRRQR